jgi:hypothetical protein
MMKLGRDGSDPGRYMAYRVTWRGEGGLRPMSGGSLQALLS